MDAPDARLVDGLLAAYRAGYFPMADGRDGSMRWFNPEERGVIPLETFHVPRSLRQRVRSGRYTVTSDRAFEDVMRACAAPRPHEPETWIDERIVRAYVALHAAGHAHSVEAWIGAPMGGLGVEPPVLVGGLYGVHIGGAFFGESMFSRPELGGTDASKVCLVHLVHHLRKRGFSLLDTQFANEHLEQFGCVEIPREAYLVRLAEATAGRVEWLPFD